MMVAPKIALVALLLLVQLVARLGCECTGSIARDAEAGLYLILIAKVWLDTVERACLRS